MNCSDAAQAARYQMIIMFIISATTSVGSVCTLYMASSYCIDAKCRLRLDRVSKRDKANAWNRRLFRHSIQVSIWHRAAAHHGHVKQAFALGGGPSKDFHDLRWCEQIDPHQRGLICPAHQQYRLQCPDADPEAGHRLLEILWKLAKERDVLWASRKATRCE